jgi:hypothetical protein
MADSISSTLYADPLAFWWGILQVARRLQPAQARHASQELRAKATSDTPANPTRHHLPHPSPKPAIPQARQPRSIPRNPPDYLRQRSPQKRDTNPVPARKPLPGLIPPALSETFSSLLSFGPPSPAFSTNTGSSGESSREAVPPHLQLKTVGQQGLNDRPQSFPARPSLLIRQFTLLLPCAAMLSSGEEVIFAAMSYCSDPSHFGPPTI